jgi:hypothetical protein
VDRQVVERERIGAAAVEVCSNYYLTTAYLIDA